MHDRVDEWVAGHLPQFEGKPLQSVAKGALDLGALEDEAEKKAHAEQAGTHADLVKRIREALGDRVQEVRATFRLTDSAACLVAGEHDIGANLERILRAAGQKVPATARILEVNPEHPLVRRLAAEQDAARFADWSAVLLDQAALAEGGQLDDPAGFVRRVNQLMLALAGEGGGRVWVPGQ
jgi:molecular chaperone HtpG